MQGHDGRKEFHRHRQRAKGTLNADPDQGCRGPPTLGVEAGALAFGRGAGPSAPGKNCQQQDQSTHAGGEIAVDHFDPGFAFSDRPAGQRGLRRLNSRCGTHWAGAAVTARPVGAAQARVSQPRESAKKHQIEGEEKRHQRQRVHTTKRRALAVTPRHPGHWRQRQGEAGQQHWRQGGEVVQIGGRHGDFADWRLTPGFVPGGRSAHQAFDVFLGLGGSGQIKFGREAHHPVAHGVYQVQVVGQALPVRRREPT